jgi:type I restriction enzyme S subunit
MATDKQHTTLNVPTLRFPEFTGEWKEATIGECCAQLEYGMNASSKKFDGENKYIRITDIDEDSCIYKTDDIVSPDGDLLEKYLVHKNDILLARTGASTGKAYLYNPNDGKMYYAGFLIKASVNPQNNSRYVFLQTQTKAYKKWVSITSMRSGQPGINSQEFAAFSFCLPPSRIEQDRISLFFEKLDERIATQRKVIERLETLINGLAVRLTSGGAANIALCDCAECKSSTLQESQLLDVGLHPVYGATGIVGYTNTADVNGNGVLIIKDGSGVGAVRYVDKPFSFTGTLNCLTAKVGYNIRYIYYCLKAFNFTPYKTGLAIPHIYFKDYSKAKIYCPSIEEQNKVVSTLSSIEEKRQIEIAILDSITYEKLYMLSNMFI